MLGLDFGRQVIEVRGSSSFVLVLAMTDSPNAFEGLFMFAAVDTEQLAASGIWLSDKPLHSKLNGRMTAKAVVQTIPNSMKCGGLTEAWRIAWMAYEHNVQ
jgi:hypothetical protein